MGRWLSLLSLILGLLPGAAAQDAATQIEMELQIVEFDQADIETLSVQGIIEADALMNLRKQGKSRLLAAPRLVTVPRIEALAAGATEYSWVREFHVLPATDESTNRLTTTTNSTPDSVRAVHPIVLPSRFISYSTVGSLLNTWCLSFEGSLIKVTMCPEYVDDPIWKDYGSGSTNSLDKTPQTRLEVPFFHRRDFSTQLAMMSGATVLVAGGMNSRDGKGVVYHFFNARLVDADGTPIQTK